MHAELATLEVRVNYRFRNAELLHRALTHSSFANENRSAGGESHADNEQLEFLGDAILGFLVSEALVQRMPDHREGQLSSQKARLVSAAHLHGVARRLDLGSFLELGRSEEMSGGRNKKTLLSDALEALIAAIYLDGGIDPVREFVSNHILDAPFTGDVESGTDIQPAVNNFKGALQELAKSRKLGLPQYVVVGEIGPPHARTFTIEARVGREWTAQADGRTKKVAAQRAARALYEKMFKTEATTLPPDNVSALSTPGSV